MPIALQLSGRRAVVVGEGPGAATRTARLEDAGAQVECVSPDNYDARVCEGAFVVVAQSADAALNRRAARDARAAGCLAYAHDDPSESDFAMPAVARRGPIRIAISTDATAPALARRLRELLETLLETSGAVFDELARTMYLRRAELPAGERSRVLTRIARRLRIEGRIVVDPPE